MGKLDAEQGFRDLASARQIAKLLADGVRLSEIIRSVNEIRKWLPDIGLGSVRLHPGARDSLEVEPAGARTDKSGQFMLAVEDCRHDPDDLLPALRKQAGDIAEAIDGQSEWASRARRSLKFCEMQQHLIV